MMHGKPGSTQKAKSVKKAMARIFHSMKKYRLFVILAIIFAIAASIIQITNPERLGDLTSDIMTDAKRGNINLDTVGKAAIMLGILYISAAILNYLQSYIMISVTQAMSKKYRHDISKKINNMPLKYFDARPYGDVLSRVTNDVDTIGMTLSQSLITLISSIVMIIGLPVVMFKTSWQLTLVCLASLPINFAFLGIVMGKSQKYFRGQQKKLGEVNGHIEETYSGQTVIKAFNAEEQSKKTFNQMNNALYSDSWKAQFLSGLMMPIIFFIGNLTYVGVLLVGGYLASKNGYSIEYIGIIVSFLMYVRLFNQPISQIGQIASQLQSTAAAAERVYEFLDEEEMEDESNKKITLENVEGNIEFDHVRFGYNSDKVIIDDFSSIAKAGDKIAIVGPTGAGKTTMVNLLMRFYEVNDGKIMIDGVNTRDLTRENIHSLFGMVLQDTWLFEGTIRDNLKYGRGDVSDEAMIEAAKMAHIDHYINTLPKGYDTILDENANISSGQKQLFTIARAMIENAPMLILDEATSSVDTRTEILIQKAMNTLMEGRTSFVIAHRLSTIKDADLILVMKDGNIIETGKHDELLNKKGFYAELYNSQFEI